MKSLQYRSVSKLIVPALLILPNILLWVGILAVDGTIIQRDFNFPVFNENFNESYFPLWNENTSQTNIERLPRLVMMSPFIALSMLGVEVSIITKIMIVGTFAFITCASYLFIKSLLIYTTNADENKKYIKLVSLLGAFVFAYNPANMQFIGGISILASVGMLPLLLHIVLKARTKKHYPLLILILPPLLFSLGHPFVFIMNVIITIVFILIVYYRALSLKHILSKLVLSMTMLVLLLAWLIIPYLSTPTSSVDLGRDQQLARDTFELVSDNNFYKIFLLERDKFLYTETAPSEGFANTIHYFVLALQTGIASIAIILFSSGSRISKRIIVFLSGGFAASTLFALGSTGAIDGPYWIAISESAVGWIFRSPLKFQLYQGMFISALFAISVVMIRNRLLSIRNYNKTIISSVLFAFIFLGSSSYGIYTANVVSFNPIKLPDEYFEINRILETRSDGYKVIYYPRYNEVATSWSEGHLVAPYDAKSSRIPTYELSTTYSYVKETLFDYPYANDLFKSSDFFELLASVGIKYVIFHNDRGYSIDQKNLDYLINSNELAALYSKNSWYLFEIKAEATQEIRAIHSVIDTDNVAQALGISSKSAAVIDTTKTSSGTNLDASLVKLRIFGDNMDIRLANEILNPSFSLWNTDDSLENWNQLNQAFHMTQILDPGSKEHVLQLSTPRSIHDIWSSLISSEIIVEPGEKYLFTLDAKTKNAYGTHAKVQGYHVSENAWKDLVFVTTESEGLSPSTLSIRFDSDWKTYSKVVTLGDDVKKIRYIINAGSAAHQEQGDGITYIRQAGAYNLDDIKDGNLSVIKNYNKISPTQYQVHIDNQGGPFILSFTEAYEKGWKASYQGNSGEIASLPLYGMINGFYIEKTGSFTVNISYQPQELFWVGFATSLLTVVAIVAYLIIPNWKEIKRHASIFASSSNVQLVYQKSDGKQILAEKLATRAEKGNDSKENNISIRNASRSERTARNTKVNDGKASIKDSIMNMVRTNPSSVAIIVAIVLTMCIPLLVTIREDLANTAAAYALDFLVVGIIGGLVLARKKKTLEDHLHP